MIGYVFLSANTLLSAPPPPVPQIGTGENAATQAGLELGNSLAYLLRQLLILLLMCAVGSVMASQGIKMLFAAWNTRVSD